MSFEERVASTWARLVKVVPLSIVFLLGRIVVELGLIPFKRGSWGYTGENLSFGLAEKAMVVSTS